MRFKPLSDQELQSLNLIEPGIYDFQVVEAKDKLSKAGNDMLELKLRVWDKQGHERLVYDYLLESMSFKLKHFCEVAGLLPKYEAGELRDVDCIGKAGKLDLAIQKDKSGQYGDRNAVKNYLVYAEQSAPQATQPSNDFDDSIPF